jgi:hypothetical protein
VLRSSFGGSAFGVRRSSFVVLRSSFFVRRSSFCGDQESRRAVIGSTPSARRVGASDATAATIAMIAARGRT